MRTNRPSTLAPLSPPISPLSRHRTGSSANGSAARCRGDRPGCAESQWRAAVAAIAHLLRAVEGCPAAAARDDPHGVILAGPSPVFDAAIARRFATWTFASGNRDACPVLTGTGAEGTPAPDGETLPVDEGDFPVGDRFCAILTPQWSFIALCALNESGELGFEFSFDPQIVETVWQSLRDRARDLQQQERLDGLFERFGPVVPHYKIVADFARLWGRELSNLQGEKVAGRHRAAEPKPKPEHSSEPSFNNGAGSLSDGPLSDVELLQAIGHEIRTPLTTIATLAKLLLKQTNLPDAARKWIENIERECSEQIDRFGLIFRAVELETCGDKRANVRLAPTSIACVIDGCIERWQKQARRRNLQLEVVLPQIMPQIASDPELLDKVLTRTIDDFTGSLPLGSRVRVTIEPAGDRLKVQLRAETACENGDRQTPLKSLGQLLALQPETGNLSLKRSATKNLFQSLGGKFIVRNRPQEGEVLTIFLPLNGVGMDVS